jgi:hypothetical protein
LSAGLRRKDGCQFYGKECFSISIYRYFLLKDDLELHLEAESQKGRYTVGLQQNQGVFNELEINFGRLIWEVRKQ